MALVQYHLTGFVYQILTQKLYYLLNLEDWNSLVFVSKEIAAAIREKLIFNFGLTDQWVFRWVKSFGQHALYHAKTRTRMERTFQIVGYSTEHNTCHLCDEYSCEASTPLGHALECGSLDHLEKILKIGPSKNDNVNLHAYFRGCLRRGDYKRAQLIQFYLHSNSDYLNDLQPVLENLIN